MSHAKPVTSSGLAGAHETTAVLGIPIARVTYDQAVSFAVDAAHRRESRIVSALAVHGVMTGVLDKAHRSRLRAFDMLTPDGQPVRWAADLFRADRMSDRLPDRVYGPQLTLELCAAAARSSLPIYLYGSRPETVNLMAANLSVRFPGLQIAGIRPSRFREATADEDADDIRHIHESGAGLVFVGLGCPRQEKWAYEHKGKINAVLVCVGAAFDFHAGTLPQAPTWMQRLGMEWLFRLIQEPTRLWRRYLFLNPAYLLLLGLQWCGLWRAAYRTTDG